MDTDTDDRFELQVGPATPRQEYPTAQDLPSKEEDLKKEFVEMLNCLQGMNAADRKRVEPVFNGAETKRLRVLIEAALDVLSRKIDELSGDGRPDKRVEFAALRMDRVHFRRALIALVNAEHNAGIG